MKCVRIGTTYAILLNIVRFIAKGKNHPFGAERWIPMVSRSIIINKDHSAVWEKIQGEFCKTFKCKASELMNGKASIKTKSSSGKPLRLYQAVADFQPQRSITVDSITGDNIVSSTYLVEIERPGSSKVTLSVEGNNYKSRFRSLVYKIMDLPFLQKGTASRLDLQLRRLKHSIENEAVE